MSAECGAVAIPPGYKKTEVGVIPEDWDVKSMDEIGQVIRGASPRPKGDKRFYGGSIPRLMVEDITRDKHWVKPSIDYLTDEGAKQSRLCKKGTLTVICSGTPNAVGLPALLAIDACIHDGILGLVHIDEKVSADFLFHKLGSLQQSLHAAATHGGTFVNLTTEAFRAFKIALPFTKAEQEAISEALSDADALIESLEQLIAKKRQIKKGAMQELLTGKRRLPGFATKVGYKHTEVGVIPEDWECLTIGNSINLLTGFPFPSAGYSKSGVRLLRGSNVKRDFIDWSEEGTEFWPAITTEIRRYVLKAGDIVIAMDGSLVGRSFAMLSEADVPAILLQRVARIRSDFIEQKFLKAWICSQRFTEHCDSVKTVTAIPHISPADIRSFKIALPPTKTEQTAIATILSDMDSEIAVLEEKLAKARQIKQGMMQELLTGRIRLI